MNVLRFTGTGGIYSGPGMGVPPRGGNGGPMRGNGRPRDPRAHPRPQPYPTNNGLAHGSGERGGRKDKGNNRR